MFVWLAIIAIFFNGIYLVQRIWPTAPREQQSGGLLLLKCSLAIGLGTVLQSVFSYFSLVLTHSIQGGICAELALLAAAGWEFGTGRLPVPVWRVSVARGEAQLVEWNWIDRSLTWLSALIVCGVALVCYLRWRIAPYGYWDAWAMWTVRAIYFFYGGEKWTAAFGAFQDHPDYPLLVPLTTANLWLWSGTHSVAAPFVTAALFSLGLAGLMFGGLQVVRGGMAGGLGGVSLLATPLVWCWGMALYADVPLAYFLLATFVLWSCLEKFPESRPRLLLLIGILLSGAAWTKNEGQLFAALALGVMAAILCLQVGVRFAAASLATVLLGMLPGALALIHFKLAFAPQNDLLEAMTWQKTLQNLVDGSRWGLIGNAVLADLRLHLPIGIILVWLAASLASGIRRTRGAEWCCLVCLPLLIGGYAYFYMTTPRDLAWHLGTSSSRLLLHVLPLAIFVLYLHLKAASPRALEQITRGLDETAVAAPPPNAETPPANLRPQVACAWLSVLLVGAVGINGIFMLLKHPEFRRFESLNRTLMATQLSSLAERMPRQVTVGFTAPDPKSAEFLFVAVRYFFAPRPVERGLAPEWIVGVHKSPDDAQRLSAEEKLEVVIDAKNSIRLFHRPALSE